MEISETLQAVAMANLSPSSYSYFFLCFTFLVLFTPSITSAKLGGLATKLIHPNSVHSPYYNPNDTIADRARRAIKGSIARFAYLQAISTSSFKTDDIRAGVIPEDVASSFMANISIGQPPVSQLVIMDTGSNLLWIQCEPCICFKQKIPIFDPAKSSTYTKLQCSSPYCVVSYPNCDKDNNCIYSMGYVDGTVTRGDLANETLTFETSDEGLVIVSNVVFGCGHYNKAIDGQPSGVLGLGANKFSLASQLGSRFSYCLGSLRDPNYAHNHIIFGDGAILQGDSTPIAIYDNKGYYLNLQSISIGDEKLDIDPNIFENGVLLDSATTSSWLPTSAFEVLTEKVEKLVGGTLTRVTNPNNPKDLCYKGIIDRDLKGFPTVGFNFIGGAQLALDTYSLFSEVNVEQFCMTISESDSNDETIIGTYAQQFYNIGLDIPQMKVYMERIDCEFLEG